MRKERSGSLSRTVVLLVALAPAAGVARGAEVASAAWTTGTWRGTLSVSGVSLRLTIHLEAGTDGLTGSLDSPDQGATGIPLSAVAVDGDRVRLASAAIGAEFVARAVGDREVLEGVWRQAGIELPLRLQRGAVESEVARRVLEPLPAEPPYRIEPVVFTSLDEAVELAGTLTLPEGKGPFPAVLLVSGSGPQDRDSTLMGHRPFAVLADHLTRLGMAVLRFDDRGVGASTGDLAAATVEDIAADARAGWRWLRARQETDATAVGLIGHSEGALIASMVAASEPAVGFLVLLGPPGVPGKAVLDRQGELIARAAGADDETVRRDRARRQEVIAAVLAAADTPSARRAVREVFDRHAAGLSGSGHGLPAANLESQAMHLASPWFRDFLRRDPRPVLARVRCPVLALWGEKDLQVPPEQSRPALEAAFKGEERQLTVRVLPGLNHLLQTADTGSPSEYGRIQETMAAEALELIAGWIRGVTAAFAEGR